MYKVNIPSRGVKSDKPSNSTTLVNQKMFLDSFSERSGKVILLYGDSIIFKMSLLLAVRAISDGSVIPIVDGCNRFDVHAITRYARKRKMDPDALLRRIFISRGFTCYQMESAISDKLPVFISNHQSRSAMVFGLLDTFYDQQAPQREVEQILVRLLEKFRVLKSEGISLLLSCTNWKVLPRERNHLITKLKLGVDKVYHLETTSDGRIQLFLEHHSRSLTR